MRRAVRDMNHSWFRRFIATVAVAVVALSACSSGDESFAERDVDEGASSSVVAIVDSAIRAEDLESALALEGLSRKLADEIVDVERAGRRLDTEGVVLRWLRDAEVDAPVIKAFVRHGANSPERDEHRRLLALGFSAVVAPDFIPAIEQVLEETPTFEALESWIRRGDPDVADDMFPLEGLGISSFERDISAEDEQRGST